MKIPLDPGTAQMRRIESQVSARLTVEYAPDSFRAFTRAQRDAARRFWSQRAWSEYAAMPALSQILLKGIAEKAPMDESAVVAGIVQDEALHTQLSQRAAEALGGYIEDVPDELAFDPYAFATPSPHAMIGDVVIGCLLGETISRALIRARVAFTQPAGLKAIVMRTLKDESVHVAFAWAVADRVIPSLSARARKDIAQLVEPARRASQRGTAGRGQSARARKAQEKLKDVVAAAGLGSCSADEERAVVRDLFDTNIVPRLQTLGVPLE